MSFTSFPFFLFLGAVYVINWLLQRFQKKNKGIYTALLLLESYAFITIADWKTSISVLLLTVICFVVAGQLKHRQDKGKSARFMLGAGLVLVIGPLCLFKYYDFAAESICKLLSLTYTPQIAYIPIGISFFTFSAAAYLIDIYRGKYLPFERFTELAAYMAFFPKFVSGPVMRPEKFQNQLDTAQERVNLRNFQTGIQIIVIGLFKKMVLADHLAVFTDDVFMTPQTFNTATCLWGMLSYSLQIYFDFSGYSDIAIGLAKTLGIDIDNNFNLPYISRNVTQFWKRWHISLSSWLQDYVYISLGGNRKGAFRKYANLLLTMLIGGLWHGASWNFLLWGGIHGVALIVHKIFMQLCKKKKDHTKSFVTTAISILFTFAVVTVAWVFFRAENAANAFMLLRRAFTFHNGVSQIYTWTWLAAAVAVAEVVYSWLKNKHAEKGISVKYPIADLSKISGLIAFFTFVGLTVILAYVGQTAFIYGKF